MGYDSGDQQYLVGNSGGKAEHQMTIEHLPPHTHKIGDLNVAANHTHTLSGVHESNHVYASEQSSKREDDWEKEKLRRSRVKGSGKNQPIDKNSSKASTNVVVKEVDIQSVKVVGIPEDWLEEEGGGDPGVAFENQPRYYKVLYIIKNPLNESFN